MRQGRWNMEWAMTRLPCHGPWSIPCPMSHVTFPISSESHHPVLTEIQGQFFEQPIDQRGAVLVEEVGDGQRALLWMTVGKDLRLRPGELTFERFVATLRRVNDFRVQSLQVVFHLPQRRL